MPLKIAKFKEFMHVILTILLLFGLSLAATEPGLVRDLKSEPFLLYLETDLPGSRSSWQLGTSISGSPDFHSLNSSFLLPTTRNPMQLAGIGSSQILLWKPFAIGFNGENGRALSPAYRIASSIQDTPSVHLQWEQAAFEGNTLEMSFQRKLLDSLLFEIYLLTQSTDSSGEFRYQNTTHQPYLGTLGRDSSTVPLAGRNLSFDGFLISPLLEWQREYHWFQLQATLYRLKNDESSRYQVLGTSDNPLFHDAPFQVSQKYSSLSAHAGSHHSSIPWEFHHHWVALENAERDTRDETIDPVTEGNQHWGEFSLQYPNYSLQSFFRYDSRQFSKWFDGKKIVKWELWEDQQQWGVQWEDSSLGYSELAITRNSSSQDQQSFTPSISLHAHMEYKESFLASSFYRMQSRYPSVEETRFASLNRTHLPNGQLVSEKQHNLESRLQWKKPYFSLGTSMRYDFVHQPIRLGWTDQSKDILTAEQAFTYQNVADLEDLSYGVWGQLLLGNWKLNLSTQRTIFRNRHSLEPLRNYKSSLQWDHQAVNGKLGIHLLWDSQWIATTEDFALANDSTAYRVNIPHHFLLNFTARMQILDFGLYTRIENLNHMRITHETGYSPPGVTFRYGIEWTLKD